MKQIILFIKTKVILIPVCLLILFVSSYANPDTVAVEMPQILASQGDTINIPITITSDLADVTPEILAVSIKLNWDSNVLKYIKIEKGTSVPIDWLIIFNVGQDYNDIQISMAGTSSLINNGDLAVITFEVVAGPGNSTNIHFYEMMFNEGEPAARISDGIVTIPAPPMADFSADDTSGSAPFTVSFIDLSAGYITEWLWEFGDDSISIEKEPIHTYQDSGTYSVRLTVTGPAGSDIKEKTDYIKVIKPPVSVSLFCLTANIIDNNVCLTWTVGNSAVDCDIYIERSCDGKNFSTIDHKKRGNTAATSKQNSFIDRNLPPDIYYYRLKQIDNNGGRQYSNIVKTTVRTPITCSLSQNYPNPFNSMTVIKYQLSKSGKVTLKIYNPLGQEIRTLVDEVKKEGYYEIHWDGRSNKGLKVSSGIYILKFKSRNFSDERKMLILW